MLFTFKYSIQISLSKIALILFFIGIGFQLSAQNDSIPRKDLYDVISGAFKVNKKPVKDSSILKTKKVFFTVLPGFGYSQEKGFAVVNNTNASFYSKRDSITKISSVDVNMEYTQYRQFLFRSVNNIWTKSSKYFIKGDWKYMVYSTKAYGLGGVHHDSDAELINYNHIRLYELLMKELTPDFLAGIGYHLDYHYNIRSDASNNGHINQEIRKYGLNDKSTSSGVGLTLLYDQRKNLNNPMQGWYANMIYRVNLTLLGSNTNWTTLQLDVRKYFRLPIHSNNVLALWNYNWFTLGGKQPYFDLPGNGWDTKANISRAYRQGRFMAKNMLYGETEYRFDISRNGLFAGVVYANLLSVSNATNDGFDKVLPGAGGGIRILTNKYSDTHFILTYSVGKFGARGFSINIGEAF